VRQEGCSGLSDHHRSPLLGSTPILLAPFAARSRVRFSLRYTGDFLQQLSNRPHMIRQAGDNCGRGLERMMPADEVVEREVQRQRRPMVRPFAAVPVRQTRQAPDRHSHAQVLPFGVARANAVHVRRAETKHRVGVDHLTRRVAGLPSFLRLVAVYLDELGEVDPIPEGYWDRRAIGAKSVRRKLEAASRCLAQFEREGVRRLRGALVKMPRDNEFGPPFESDEAPRIPAAVAIAVADARTFFAADERPEFVRLDILNGEVLNGPRQEPLAGFASANHRAENRVPVDTDEPLRRTNGVPFQQQPEAEHRFLRREATPVLGARARVRECAGAGVAAMALRAVAVPAKPVHGLGAEGAEHDEPPFRSAAVRLEWECHVTFGPDRLIVIAPGLSQATPGFSFTINCTVNKGMPNVSRLLW
jgi:hypothetical protein